MPPIRPSRYRLHRYASSISGRSGGYLRWHDHSDEGQVETGAALLCAGNPGILEYLFAARGAKGVQLQAHVLVVGRNPRISDFHFCYRLSLQYGSKKSNVLAVATECSEREVFCNSRSVRRRLGRLPGRGFRMCGPPRCGFPLQRLDLPGDG